MRQCMNKFIKVPALYHVVHRIKNDRDRSVDHQVSDAKGTVNLNTIRKSMCSDEERQG